MHRRGVAAMQRSISPVLGQLRVDPLQLRLPVTELCLHCIALRVGLQPFGPGFGRGGPGGQHGRLACHVAVIGVLQVLQENAPGHPVHRQVMNHQEQALAAIGQGRQYSAQQRTLLQVQAALRSLAQGL